MGKSTAKAKSNGKSNDKDAKDTNAITDANDASHTGDAKMPDKGKIGSMIPSPITRLRSEAVFYPKFDNESRTNQLIRKEMMEKVNGHLGYLEVTLKHSGSLILWSGGQRFYSKNAMDNAFCHVAEILLRQHFFRAWRDDHPVAEADADASTDPSALPSADASTSADQLEQHYQECSEFLETNRLTLAFEVVTAVLGDHGDIPHRDFVMLTAIADRDAERFYSTNEVIEFAQRFRLPHNDTWMVSTSDGAHALFRLYASAQETGTANILVTALSDKSISSVHIASMYPHHVFQGDILEGIIIRYVPYTDASKADAVHAKLDALADTANRYLRMIPPDLPPCFASLPNTVKSGVLTVDIRKLLHESAPSKAIGVPPAFEKSLKQALQSSNSQEPRRTTDKLGTKQINFAKLIKDLATAPTSDAETKRIANLVNLLTALKRPVNYSIVQEKVSKRTVTTNGNDQHGTHKHTRRSEAVSERWLCTIHVLHDQTFYKFQKEKTPQCMQLFRGFCIEFQSAEAHSNHTGTDSSGASDGNNLSSQTIVKTGNRKYGTNTNAGDDGSNILMLKMKLLPYMVRTFICRNNLHLVTQEGQGPEAFQGAAKRLMTRWGISKPSQNKWMPFFRQWAYYALAQLRQNEAKRKPNKKRKLKKKDNVNHSPNVDRTLGISIVSSMENNNGDDDNATSANDQVQLPPLTSGAYLKHLIHFTHLYEQGQTFAKEPSMIFPGIVIVVALEDELAAAHARALGKCINGNAQIMQCSAASKEEKKTGAICHTTVAGANKQVKKFLRSVKDYSIVILVGCDKATILQQVGNTNESRKLLSLASFWKGFNHVEVAAASIDGRKDTDAHTDIDDAGTHGQQYTDGDLVKVLVEKIQAAAQNAPASVEDDGQPNGDSGITVFIPGIPGCGKSTMLRPETLSLLEKRLAANEEDRKVKVLVGDDLGKNFWKTMEKEGKKAGSSVILVDKNIPPSAWENVGKQCGISNGYPVPVFPDTAALETTVFEGARNPNGSFRDGVPHFYPFSLHYLAVCMMRVSQRKPSSHPGNLDSGLSHACMVVALFYSFYRDISADEMRHSLHSKLVHTGALDMMDPIVLPFFRSSSLPPMPEDLEQVLTDAIQLQYGYDLKRQRVKEKDAPIQAMEKKLRKAMETHAPYISSLTVSETTARDAFLDQCIARVKTVSHPKGAAGTDFSMPSVDQPRIAIYARMKLVSIDIPKAAIHAALKDNDDEGVTEFFKMVFGSKPKPENFEKMLKRDSRFIGSTHITMAHKSRSTPSQMVETFSHLNDASIPIVLASLLWNSRVAAFAVTLPNTLEDGRTVPQSENDFAHLTLWANKGVKAFEANQLDGLVDTNKASRVTLSKEIRLEGKLSFWGENNKPLQL